MNISVIICTKDRKPDLEKLIESLTSQTHLPDELIIVDASQNEETKQFLKEKKDKISIEIIYKKTSAGLTHQRNIGTGISKGDYIFFFDDDVVLEDNYLQITLETFRQFKCSNIGGIMGRITNISKMTKFYDVFFKKIFFLSDTGKGKIKRSGLPSVQSGDNLTFVESISGCCMAYSKEVFEEFRFDENLKEYGYMEDVDFSFRVSKKFKLLYQPKARLKHFPTTYRKADTKELKKMLIRHNRYLFRKNMPKYLMNYMAHWISIVGLLLYNALILKDLRGCKGIIEGLIEPLKC